jgi:hypothetical protein
MVMGSDPVYQQHGGEECDGLEEAEEPVHGYVIDGREAVRVGLLRVGPVRQPELGADFEALGTML